MPRQRQTHAEVTTRLRELATTIEAGKRQSQLTLATVAQSELPLWLGFVEGREGAGSRGGQRRVARFMANTVCLSCTCPYRCRAGHWVLPAGGQYVAFAPWLTCVMLPRFGWLEVANR